METASPSPQPRPNPSRTRLLRWGAAGGAVALTTAALWAGTGTVWANESSELRLGHLSPETGEVDIYFAPASGPGSDEEELIMEKVAYGNISDYQTVEAGDYTVAMRPAGAEPTSEPVIVINVQAEADAAHTLAVFGEPDDLSGNLLTDELEAPGEDSARVRLVQAASEASVLDVAAEDGTNIADSLDYGGTTEYAEVPSGTWDLAIDPEEADTSTVELDLEGGNVYSLIVLDDDEEGFTIQPVTDAGGMADMPEGGVDTGAGGVATEGAGAALWGGAAAVTAVLAGIAVWVARARRAADDR